MSYKKVSPWDMTPPIGSDHPRFEDYPLFQPDLSPMRMLQIGVFDGCYFRGEESLMSEYPAEWWEKARIASVPTLSMNFFGVSSATSYDRWTAENRMEDTDPLGWFQWYCRMSLGRRVPSVDEIQIRRWASAKRRLEDAVIAENSGPRSQSLRRQELIHWACDPYPDRPEAPSAD